MGSHDSRRITKHETRSRPKFFDAFRNGDVEGLRGVLAADVELVGDAGGKAPALGRTVVGADRVARLLASLPQANAH